MRGSKARDCDRVLSDGSERGVDDFLGSEVFAEAVHGCTCFGFASTLVLYVMASAHVRVGLSFGQIRGLWKVGSVVKLEGGSAAHIRE